VDYRLTELGASLLPVVKAIKGWADSHFEQVEAARASYDTARAENLEPPSDRRAEVRAHLVGSAVS
jgi:hypothetical protein